MFGTKAPTPEVSALAADVRRQMEDDCQFWTTCVEFAINEDDTVDQCVHRATEVADRLLEARRARFPL